MLAFLPKLTRALLVASFTTALACDRSPKVEVQSGEIAKDIVSAAVVPGLALVVVYGSEKKTWFEEQARAFERTQPMTPSGRSIRIDARAMGSGEAMQAILNGEKAAVFSPASSVYIPLLNDAYLTKSGRNTPLAKQGDALVLSPVVVGMWRPMAEKLGWPKKQLSWSDLLSVATNPKGWGAKGYPQWGQFKFGHTHPEYSNSGFLAVLAEAYAGAKKTRDLTPSDLDSKPVRAFISGVEDTILHYGKSTGFFSDKMIERGPSYLSAAVLYENLVIESRAKNADPPLVAVYPVEGSFWSDHPYCVLDAEWVGADERAAAAAFLAFLKARPAQERAQALGFRPSDPSIAIATPIDEAHGVDAKQPQTVLQVPGGATLAKLLDVWKATKKGTDAVVVFDKSGSMRGNPLAQAKAGARTFLGALAPRDEVSLLFFDARIFPATKPVVLASGLDELYGGIDGVSADGGTALYDAIATAYDASDARAKAHPSQIHAIVVMTDGRDESSKNVSFADLKTRLSGESARVRVFTIAYGEQAESKVLSQIAEAGRGSFAKGDVSTIRDVFLDMASFL
jgi:Ca-activated chloride channel homolog